jgi:hypothetical protein
VPLAGPDGTVTGDDGWLTVRLTEDRAADVNRLLVAAGIYASRLEAGTNLEALFLELTRGESLAAPSVAPGAGPEWVR